MPLVDAISVLSGYHTSLNKRFTVARVPRLRGNLTPPDYVAQDNDTFLMSAEQALATAAAALSAIEKSRSNRIPYLRYNRHLRVYRRR